MIHNVNKTKGPNVLQNNKIDYVCMLPMYARKHTQSINFVVYACKHTQQASKCFCCVCFLVYTTTKISLIAVYASKHTQQIYAYQCHLPLLLPTSCCYKSLLPCIYNLVFSTNLQSRFSNKYATSIQCFSFGISTTTFYPKQIERYLF